VAVIANGRLLVEGTVGELLGLGRLVVVAQPLAEAAAVTSRLLGAERVSVVDGALHVRTRSEDAARINRALVRAGIDVTGLRQESRTLEEVFLQLTGAGPDPDDPPPDDRPRPFRRSGRRRSAAR
jgi:ABC-2 type transport system ATP-binding protein